MTAVAYGIVIAAVLLAVGVVIWDRRRTKQTMERLNAMVDRALAGTFTEDSYDESLLSALEAKLARYLAASAVTAGKVQGEKDRIKSLISDIAHQTRTPLSNVLLYAQLLAEQDLPAESRPCVAALEAQAEKLQTLIEALVKTSRLESGIVTLHPVSGLLNPMLESALEQLRPKAAAKGIALDLTPTAARAVFDPQWTEEAVVNLLDNAVKYTPEGGRVTASAAEYQFFTCVRVSDTGPGISEEEQPKVFQRFYRGPAHQTEEGVGIGLYLTRRIAEGQSGYVKVRSRQGEGSEFSLYLPKN